MQQSFEYYIFDFDGTMVDSVTAWGEATGKGTRRVPFLFWKTHIPCVFRVFCALSKETKKAGEPGNGSPARSRGAQPFRDTITMFSITEK